MSASDREPYSDPEKPAADIDELLKYLGDCNDGSWLYRGQVRRYPGPLLPSGFRHILGSEPVIQGCAPDSGESLRGIGRRFIGNFPWDFHDHARAMAARVVSDATTHSGPRVQATERGAEAYVDYFFGAGRAEQLTAFNSLQELAETSLTSLAVRSLDPACEMKAEIIALARQHGQIMCPDHPDLIRYINDYHRNPFLTEVLIGSLGFLAGSIVGQHYGFFSGMLDATTDLDVAAFFATHRGRSYALVAPDPDTPVGIIYRFPRLDKSRTAEQVLSNDYHSGPGTVVGEDILRALEVAVSADDSVASIHTCFDIRRAPDVGRRRYDLLRFPVDCVTRSRIGKQHGAFIIPDEVRKVIHVPSQPNPFAMHPSVATTSHLCQQSIEDLHFRDGVTAFYFRLSGKGKTNGMSPVDLWPSEDFFLEVIAFLFLAGLNFYASPSFGMPLRLDLIDPGFGSLDTDALRNRGRRLVDSAIISREPEDAVAQHLDNRSEVLTYLSFKAATLCRHGYALSNIAILDAALRTVRKARDIDGSSCVLAALEATVLEGLGRRDPSEIEGVLDRLTQARRADLGATAPDGEVYDFFMKCLQNVHGWRYRIDFAWLVYNLYMRF